MAKERATTLLRFAIAASGAVVPVLLAVLVLVAMVRPLDPAEQAARTQDRHISVRLVAALKTFERAIVKRDKVTIGPPTALLVLDRVPQCRSAWDGHDSMLDRVRALLARSGVPAPSPAQRIASRLTDLDHELLRFSTGADRRVSDAVGFDSLRWFEAVNAALDEPVVQAS